MERIMLCVALWLFFFGAFAQSDSSLIDTIYVQSTVHSSSHISQLENLSNSNNIVDALQRKEAIYIKNYGGYNLSTISLRGSSASQTGIYWNNLSISNNMLGLLDLSLIPISFIEDAQVVYGSESSTFGSGNIGGGIYLKNKVSEGKISISTNIASFNNYSHTVKFNLGNKLKSSIKLNYQHFKNDYPYLTTTNEQRNLENGNGIQLHGMYNSYINVGKNKLSFNYWTTYANRNIPYTRRQTAGDDSTIDINNRFNFNLKRIKNQHLFEWNTAYFINNNQFFQTNLINKNIIHSFENRVQYRKTISAITYTVGNDISYHTAFSQNYINSPKQIRTALFGNVNWGNKFFKLDLRGRQEIIDNNIVPFIPEVSLSKNLFKRLYLGIKANKIYRNPTLNDLYWVPGGNLDLIAESGWASEANLNYSINFKNTQNTLSVNAYNRNINNWIIWTPEENSFIFRPFNISEVWSRGIEITNNTKIKVSKKSLLNYSFNYNLNKSTYQTSLQIPRVNLGDQLFYTPIHQMNNSISIQYNKQMIELTNRYYSQSIGINENIKAYNITDLRVSQKLTFQNQEINLTLSINNIFNKQYEIIEFRPMPRRNLSLNLNYKLN